MPCLTVPLQEGKSPSIQVHVAQLGTSEQAFNSLAKTGDFEAVKEEFANSYHQAIALLDSGAECSGISPQLAEKLALVATGQRTIRGVHGTMRDCEAYEIELVVIENHPAIKLEVASIEMHYDILLGMDFLTQGTFSIDWTGRCILCF